MDKEFDCLSLIVDGNVNAESKKELLEEFSYEVQALNVTIDRFHIPYASLVEGKLVTVQAWNALKFLAVFQELILPNVESLVMNNAEVPLKDNPLEHLYNRVIMD